MTITPEMKQEVLDSVEAMELLSNMVDYRKDLLLDLIRSGRILKYLLKETHRFLDLKANPAVQEQTANLPPGGEQEVNYMLLTGIDPEMELSEWTAPEARIVNEWWKREFPDEKNPLGLEEDELPEKLEAEPEMSEAEMLMNLPDIF